jgi:poly(3-hydroxybutyrate) depolymerase
MRTPMFAAALLLTTAAACGDDGGGDPGVDAPAAVHAFVPTPTGVCPTIAPGNVMFAPAGLTPRMVNLDFTGAGPGPLILYWHATGSSPSEVNVGLGATRGMLTAGGAVIATPSSDPTAGQFEWFIVNMSSRQDDFLLADEIVGCLAQAGRIDTDHVHSMGMSAGALQTTAMSYLRSSYIASVATYSGGVPAIFSPPPLDPGNLFAALIFHGGPTDAVFNVDFQDAAITYHSMLTTAGHFAAICNHGDGHTIPQDAAPSVAQFFADNGFGDWPSPYAAAGLPATFPTYCTR